MNPPGGNKIFHDLLKKMQSSSADRGKGVACEVVREEVKPVTIAIPSP